MRNASRRQQFITNRPKYLVGDRDHFLICSVLNRMRDVNGRRIRAEGLSLLVRPIGKHITRHKQSGDAELLQVQRVMHTARRAAPSIR